MVFIGARGSSGGGGKGLLYTMTVMIKAVGRRTRKRATPEKPGQSREPCCDIAVRRVSSRRSSDPRCRVSSRRSSDPRCRVSIRRSSDPRCRVSSRRSSDARCRVTSRRSSGARCRVTSRRSSGARCRVSSGPLSDARCRLADEGSNLILSVDLGEFGTGSSKAESTPAFWTSGAS